MIATPERAPGVGRATVDYQALADFRHELRKFIRVSEEAARDAGLEPQQHQLLLALRGAPPSVTPTIAWLAERLQLQHHSVVGLVDRLSRKRLVVRQRDADDHRRVVVALTGTGDALLLDLSVFHQKELRLRAPALVSAVATVVRATRHR